MTPSFYHMQARLNSYAKLNLYLRVINKRKDNFHNIETIFERISLCDKIIITPRRDSLIKIISNSKSVPSDSSNLAYRSAQLLRREFNINSGVNIRIIKRIPVGSGMGGGSSNAAYTLIGLNRLWKLKIPTARLAALAGRIGSDVPFFIYNQPFAIGRRKGDLVSPIGKVRGINFWHIIVVPKIKVLTPLIYRKLDGFSTLTRKKRDVKILCSLIRKNDPNLLADKLINDLEKVTVSIYKQVNQVKNTLTRLGLGTILMSGSGPTVFGIVRSRKSAQALYTQLRKINKTWLIFISRTV